MDNIIAEADRNIVNFEQPSGQNSAEFVGALWKEASTLHTQLEGIMSLKQQSLKG